MVHHKEEANMELTTQQVTVPMWHGCVDPPVVVYIPVATDFKDVGPMEELIPFKPKMEKIAKRKNVNLTLESATGKKSPWSLISKEDTM